LAGSAPDSTPRPYTVCASVTVGLPVAQDQRDVDDMVKAFGIAQSLTDVSQHVANARDMLLKLRPREVADCYNFPFPPPSPLQSLPVSRLVPMAGVPMDAVSNNHGS